MPLSWLFYSNERRQRFPPQCGSTCARRIPRGVFISRGERKFRRIIVAILAPSRYVALFNFLHFAEFRRENSVFFASSLVRFLRINLIDESGFKKVDLTRSISCNNKRLNSVSVTCQIFQLKFSERAARVVRERSWRRSRFRKQRRTHVEITQ